LNADDFEPQLIPEGAFVVYQGHHGDVGAQYADVCLPGSAYTEKSPTWINTEGRAQIGRAAVGPPAASRDDWKIIRAVSEVLDTPLPYDTIRALRERMFDISPTLVRYNIVEKVSNPAIGLKQLINAKASSSKAQPARTGPLKKPITDFYRTDPISRS
jgi:NADH dehydrogenase (ubiquinone) Fe-S protein 1